MSTDQISVNTDQFESKSSKKKKSKAAASINSPDSLEADPSVAAEPTANGTDPSGESPYMKELNK